MTITPQDIQSKQFHVRMRGFDMDEVDKFLENVAEELLIASLENKQLLARVETMEKELANYKNKEQAFQSAILSAQRISDEMQARSRQEAAEIVTTATKTGEELETRIRHEVDELVEKARQEAAELRASAENAARQTLADADHHHRELTRNINRLIEMKSRIMYDLRRLLNNYLDHIEEAVPTGLNALEPLPEEEESTAAPAPLADFDLEDLFEKIDLPEQAEPEALADLDQPAALDISDIEPLDDDENLAPSIPITALNSEEEDLLFSLDDPLDELEPSFSINEDDKPG